MDTKKGLPWLSFLFGELLIITAFLLFRGDLSNNVLLLNIIVSSVIYALFFLDILIPWVDLSNKSNKEIGSIGIRWFFTWLYAVIAILFMVVSNVGLELLFSTQLIIQGILVFFLLLGVVASSNATERVEGVYSQESTNRRGVDDMKLAIRNLKDKMSTSPRLPEHVVIRINVLEENIRFLSPCNLEEAYELEHSFVSVLNDICLAISDFSMNEELVEKKLRRCEQLYESRKNTYSK